MHTDLERKSTSVHAQHLPVSVTRASRSMAKTRPLPPRFATRRKDRESYESLRRQATPSSIASKSIAGSPFLTREAEQPPDPPASTPASAGQPPSRPAHGSSVRATTLVDVESAPSLPSPALPGGSFRNTKSSYGTPWSAVFMQSTLVSVVSIWVQRATRASASLVNG